MKKISNRILRFAIVFGIGLILCSTARAQTATWTGGAGDSEWNSTNNWDILAAPAEGTNAVIGIGVIANYDLPMAATSFATLNLSGLLNINTNGFVIDAGQAVAPIALNATSRLNVTSNGIVTVANSGRMTMSTDSTLFITGGTFLMTNNIAGVSGINFGVNGNNNGAGITNNGGTIILDQRLESRGRFSRFIMNGGTLKLGAGINGIFESSNDQERPWLINGGSADLGDFVISRTLPGPGAGLVISNGVVNVTSLRVGNNASRAFASIYGGVLTNTGAFTICDRINGATSGERRIQFLLRGGMVVSTTPEGIIVANQSNTGAAAANIIGGILDINAGTLISEGITLVKDATLSNAHGTLLLGGSGSVYLGSVGLIGNVGAANTTYTITMSGGTLGAKDNYSINANMALTGITPIIRAADIAGTPFNITHNGTMSGSGGLNKTGAGVLTLTAMNTYSGTTTINAGTLALSGGTILNSPQIIVGSGATFDVSAGYTLSGSRTLSGFGTISGILFAAAGSTINPGTNTVTGTLTITGGLTESGGAITHLDLSNNPLGANNDFISITGDLSATGTNTIEVAGTLAGSSVYPLIQYGGNFNGTLANFTLTGASGSLSNNTTTKTIYLVTQSAVRAPTNIVWVGNSTSSDWDTLVHSNWLNGATLDYFVSGDAVRFDNIGATYPSVNIVGSVGPASVIVDSSSNYTFTGSGSIGGLGGLTKTNTGTLTILATNSYTGPTRITGGVVEISSLANSGSPSGLGAAAADTNNLVLDTGTLRYIGETIATDRGATLEAGGGTLDVFSNATALTLNGVLTGAGSLTKTGAGTLVLPTANSYAGGTLVSSGAVQLNAAGVLGSGAVTNSGSTLRFANGTYTLNNTFEFSGNSTIDVNNSSGDLALNGAWSGNGTVTFTNFPNAARTFTIGGNGSGGGSMTAFAGTINLGESSGNLRFNDGGGNLNLGSVDTIFDLGTGGATLLVRNGNVTINLGSLSGGADTKLSGRASGAAGTVTYSIGAKNLSTTFAGTIKDGNNATAIIKVGSGTLNLTGPSTHTGTTFITDGTLSIDGSLISSAVWVNAGRLTGIGTLGGPVIVQGGATFSPGNSIGQMTINNSLQLDPGSITFMELDKTTATNDSIAGLSSVNYGGTLVVTNLSGALSAGDTFTLFSASSYSGVFENINLPTLASGLSWNTNSLLVDGTLKVVAAGPTIASVSRVGSDIVFNGTGGVPSGSYYILTSTNIAAPISNWTSIATNTFEADGSFGFTNAISASDVQRFYILQQAP